MNTVLVIGAHGQLASEISVLKDEFQDLKFYFTPSSETDISQMESVRSIIHHTSPHFIINCGAYTAVDKAESDENRAYQINETGAQNLASLCHENNIFLIHISTDFVFDGTKKSPYIEADPVHPISVYGASKLKGEEAIIKSQCNFTIIRTSWLYSHFGNNFVKTMMRLGAEKSEINVVSDQIGSPTYCRDLARFILTNLHKFSSHNQEIYHFSNEGIASWYEFAEEIMKLNHFSCKVNPIPTSEYPTPASRPAYSVMDKTKVKSHFSYAIPHWKESLAQCIALIQASTK